MAPSTSHNAARPGWQQDLVAALVVTVMLVPQSLGYALLAGLPPQVGLYASVLPLLAYAAFGTSSALAVGPVAVVAMLTASVVAEAAEASSLAPAAAAALLALGTGLVLLLAGFLRLGRLASFLSHSVIQGFIAASALIIAAGQLKHLLGIDLHGHSLLDLVRSLMSEPQQPHMLTLQIGGGVLLVLFAAKLKGRRMLAALGMAEGTALLLLRALPALAVLVTLLLSRWLDLAAQGVAVVGEVPGGLPALSLPGLGAGLSPGTLELFVVPSLTIAIIGYVESFAVAQTFARRQGDRIQANRELIALGAANVASGISGAMPVAGGFSRSAVSVDAGAHSRATGALTAIGMGVTLFAFAPLLDQLPKATLAAAIVVAVLGLVDLRGLLVTMRYSTHEALATAATILTTLTMGVEPGIVTGVLTALLVHLYHTSQPHVAIVGRIPGTEHFRNVKRHAVQTDPRVLSLRIDESLYFANAEFLAERIREAVARNDEARHVILQCSAINDIDASAAHVLEDLSEDLAGRGIALHLSEVKGPVMDRLRRGTLLGKLSGRVFLTQHEAFDALVAEASVAKG